MQIFESRSEQETQKIATALAADAMLGDIFALQGTLGAGKSVFARAFVQSRLDTHSDVPSPTFTLVQTYEIPEGLIWHFDLYRLQDPEEIFELGWEEATAGGIVLVEWPERLGPYLPAQTRFIKIAPGQNTTRTITIDD
jgi:tRNA threonylcarbamoyladenosine biosynthesis protein TsaE